MAGFRQDVMTLTKARLSALVVVTTFFGYWAGAKGEGFSLLTLLHVLLGTTLAALAAAAFNQLMEVDADAKMDRTADRPLPSKRMKPELAFVVGVVLAAFGILHLALKVNVEAAFAAAATIFTYLFLYTPMKRRTGWNTIVGAVSGAIPPVLGWVGAFGLEEGFRWSLFTRPESIFLFGVLFFWQLPHFFAIHWLHREQYRKGGFVMWGSEDEKGHRTAQLSIWSTVLLLLLMFQPWLTGFVRVWFVPVGVILTAWLLWLAIGFKKSPEAPKARKLFFGTLLYLPLLLLAALLAWR